MSKKECLRWMHDRLNHVSRGWLDILSLSIERFAKARGAAVAASLAYYALFAIFPFSLALISSASFILKDETIFTQVTELIVNFLPVSEALIKKPTDSHRSTWARSLYRFYRFGMGRDRCILKFDLQREFCLAKYKTP